VSGYCAADLRATVFSGRGRPREGSPGDPDYWPPAGCEAPTHVRRERGEWALASTPAAFECRALSGLKDYYK